MIDGGEWSASRLGCFAFRCLLDTRLDGSQSRSGRGGEDKQFLPVARNQNLVIQPVASHYTASVMHAHIKARSSHKYILSQTALIKTVRGFLEAFGLILETSRPADARLEI
jgi:hypothetical protein